MLNGLKRCIAFAMLIMILPVMGLIVSAEAGRVTVDSFDGAPWAVGGWAPDGKLAGIKAEQDYTESAEGESSMRIDVDFNSTASANALAWVSYNFPSSVQINPSKLIFMLKSSDIKSVAVRLIDNGGQYHRFLMNITSEEWAEVSVASKNSSNHWDGKNDGIVKDIKTIQFCIEKGAVKNASLLGSIYVDNFQIEADDADKIMNVFKTAKASAQSLEMVDDMDKGLWKLMAWGGKIIELFPRSQASVSLISDSAQTGNAQRITANFEGTGQDAIVGAAKSFGEGTALGQVGLIVRAKALRAVTVRFVDAYGQYFSHQLKVKKQDVWQNIRIPNVARTANYFGGKGDGIFRYPLMRMEVIAERTARTDAFKNDITLDIDNLQMGESTGSNMGVGVSMGIDKSVNYIEQRPVQGLTCYPDAVTIPAGEKRFIQAIIEPKEAFDKTADWSSSDEYVATVEHGYITAHHAGTVVITAKSRENNEVSGTCSVNVSPIVFDDIAFHWAFYDMKAMGESGLIAGRIGNRFEPDSSISRAEFLKLVLRAIDANDADYRNAAPDVYQNDWYASTVQAAVDNNIISGNESFRPNQSITRAEMALMLANAYKAKGRQLPSAASSFSDVGGDIAGYVSGVCELGIMNGVDRGRFAPDDSATRAQAAVTVRRLKDLTDYGFLPKLRAAPVREMAVTKKINVADYGVFPNDRNKNSLPGINKAIQAAKDAGVPCEVYFPKATYYVYNPDSSQNAINISNVNDLVLDGNGSFIVQLNPEKGLFNIYKGKNIIIKNFEADYEQPPNTSGEIVAVDKAGATIDVKLDPDLPSLDSWWFTQAGKITILKDPVTKAKLKDNVESYRIAKGWQSIGNRTFRVSVPDIDSYAVGDHWVIGNRWLPNSGSELMSNMSENIIFDHIFTYGSPNVYALIHTTANPAVVDCAQLLRKGRYSASNADGFHLAENAPAEWIENVTVEGTGDDGINNHTVMGHIWEKMGEGKYKINPTYHLEEGDKVGAWSASESRVLGYATVTAVEKAQTYSIITINPDIKKIRPKPADSNFPGFHPDNTVDSFFAQKYASGFVFRGNTFRYVRRYGNVTQGNNGLIEGNRYEYCSAAGVNVRSLTEADEGYDQHNIVIRNNTFANNGGDNDGMKRDKFGATISIETRASYPYGAPAYDRTTRNIVVADNSIINPYKRAIAVSASENVFVKNNKITTFDKTNTDILMEISNSGNVLIEGNTSDKGSITYDKKSSGLNIGLNTGIGSKPFVPDIKKSTYSGTRKKITAVKGTPQIDASIDDIWSKVEAVDVNTVSKTWTKNDSPVTAKVRAMWDENYLYVLGEVRDPVVSIAAKNEWLRDSLEVVLDQENNKDEDKAPYSRGTGQYRVGIKDSERSGKGAAFEVGFEDFNAKSVKVSGGYVVEMAIPWTTQKGSVKAGNVYGLEVQINDDSGVGTRDGIVTWNSPEAMSFQYTDILGDLVLSE